MAGFNSYDAIINAMTVSNKGQEVFFTKVAPIAQVAGAFHTAWAYDGNPSAGTWVGSGGSTAATMVNCSNATPGAIPVVSPTSASGENPYVVSAGAMCSTSVAGTLMLVDRLADTGSLTTSAGGSCTVTMPTGGWSRYTDGVGVFAYVESLSGVPNNGSIVTLNYTSPNNGSGRVAGAATVANAAHRMYGGSTGPFINLQGTDTGITSIESIGVTTAAALNYAVVVCKPLFVLPATTANYYTERDLVIQTPKLPKLQVAADQTACLQWIFFAGAATTPRLTGSISVVTG